MRKYLSVIIALLVAVMCFQSCVDNSYETNDTTSSNDKIPASPNEETTVLDETTPKPENSTVDSKAVHDMLYSAIGKTAECESLMISIVDIDDDYKCGMNEVDKYNQGLSASFDTYNTTQYNIYIKNKRSDDVELCLEEKMNYETKSYSVNTGDLLFEEYKSYESINYVVNGYSYSVIKRNGEEVEASKSEYDENTIYNSYVTEGVKNLLGGYKNDCLEKIDFTKAVVENSDGATSIIIQANREVYGVVLELLNPSHDEEKNYTYLDFKDTTLTFVISEGYLTSLKYEGLKDDYDTNDEAYKYQPWSLEYNFSGFDGNFTINPPEGYENFELKE